MSGRLRTLVLDANGFSWKEIAADTAVLGLLRLKDYGVLPKGFRHIPILRGFKHRFEQLSYVNDWKEALCEAPALDVRVCNITNLVDYTKCVREVDQFDLIVVLHSAAGDSLALLRRSVERLRRRHAKLVVFIGNEYDLMSEKFDFIRASRADYVCSQLPIESARWLYATCGGADVVPMPHALNPNVYQPGPFSNRPLDLGFIGALYPWFIGDVERTGFIEAVRVRTEYWGLECDVRAKTVPRAEWAAFLNRCKGTIGGESGTYYLDRRGDLIADAKAFLMTNPLVGFGEVYSRFFKDTPVEHVSGKCISSRHFEAIGTRTCQVLLEGDYNGILRAGEHYISVRKDLADLDDAILAFKDAGLRETIADRAYKHVMDSHTYAHRVKSLLRAIDAA